MKDTTLFATKGLLLDSDLIRNLKLIANDYDITMNTLVEILLAYIDNGYSPDESNPPCSMEVCNRKHRTQKNYRVDYSVFSHIKRQAIERRMPVNDLINWCFNCIVNDEESLSELIFQYLENKEGI